MPQTICRSAQLLIMNVFILLLSGCMGGGTNSVDVLAPVQSAKGTLDNVKGTIGYAMDLEKKAFSPQSALTTQLKRTPGDTNLAVADGPSFSLKKNFIGGLDLNVDGKDISLAEAEILNDTAWHKTIGDGESRFSLSLWNAGKEDREGLLGNAQGQNFHKIIGYDFTEGTKNQSRGHIVYGENTSFTNLQSLTRQATYDGYFSTFITKENMDSNHYDNNSAIMSGGMKMVADFDKNTISGKTTNITMREAGSYDFENQNFEIGFEEAKIVNDGKGGAVYKGSLSSTHKKIDGAEFAGSFFGSEAQETAGVLKGKTNDGATSHVVDGFFSAAR